MSENFDYAKLAESWPYGAISPENYHDTRSKLATLPIGLLDADASKVALADWPGDLTRRRVDVHSENLTIECFGTPSSTKKLYVFLNSGKDRTGNLDTRFERVSWQPWLDGVCLYIEDSTRKWLSPLISAGWYFGSRETHALPIIAKIVEKVQSYYGVASENVSFVGSSSGGFAALWLADIIEGATAFAGNPQFYVQNFHASSRFALAGVDLNEPSFIVRTSLDHLMRNKRSRFFVTINASAEVDYQGQLMPLLTAWKLAPPTYGLNIYGNLQIYCRNFQNLGAVSPHHAFDDVHEFNMLVSVINLEISLADKKRKLNTLHEMQGARQALADKVFFYTRWSEFFHNLDLPLVVRQHLLSSSTGKFPLKKSNGFVFYQVTWGELGRYAHISLRSKRGHGELAPVFDVLANTCGGRHINNDGSQMLTLGRVSHRRAKKAFISFVGDTYPMLWDAIKVVNPASQSSP